MFSWLEVLVINVLLLAMSTGSSSNKSANRSSPENHFHFSIKNIIERGMSVRDVNIIDSWSAEVFKYNATQINSLQEVYDYLKLLAECPYGHVKLQNLTIKRVKARFDAITEKGNYIPYLNISIGSYVQKPAIVIIGGTKGCHWLTVAAAVHVAQQLVVYYDRNYEHTSRVTWIIIPVLNPDGYNVTLTDKEMRNWRKNMGQPPKPRTNETEGKNCFGVDLSLNFEYQWMFYDYKQSSWCDDNYADKPFSQNESKAIRDTVRDHLDAVKIFVTLGQNERLFMYPFRYTVLKPIFWKMYEKVVNAAATAAYHQHFRRFEHGHVLHFKNQTAGELDDWIMAHFGVTFGFTYEIANWLSNNETLSAKEIEWINDETFAALKATAKVGVKFNEMGFLPSSEVENNCRTMYPSNILVFVAIILLQIMFLT